LFEKWQIFRLCLVFCCYQQVYDKIFPIWHIFAPILRMNPLEIHQDLWCDETKVHSPPSCISVGYTDVMYRHWAYHISHYACVWHVSHGKNWFTFAIMLSPVRLSSVCLSSVTLVHPTQAVVIFHNFSRAFGTLAIR